MKRFGHRPATVLYRPATVLALTVIGAVSVTACSSGGGGTSGSGSGGHVTITVGCEPPKTQAAQRSFFVQDDGIPEDVFIAALAIACVPTIVFFLIFQRNIMAGLTAGGVKG